MGEAVSNSLPLNIVTLFIPVLFFFLGLNSNLDEVKKLFIKKTPLVSGVVIQILVLPVIGFVAYLIFRNTIFSLAAVIVLIVPGGHISGLLTHIKKRKCTTFCTINFDYINSFSNHNCILVNCNFFSSK